MLVQILAPKVSACLLDVYLSTRVRQVGIALAGGVLAPSLQRADKRSRL